MIKLIKNNSRAPKRESRCSHAFTQTIVDQYFAQKSQKMRHVSNKEQEKILTLDVGSNCPRTKRRTIQLLPTPESPNKTSCSRQWNIKSAAFIHKKGKQEITKSNMLYYFSQNKEKGKPNALLSQLFFCTYLNSASTGDSEAIICWQLHTIQSLPILQISPHKVQPRYMKIIKSTNCFL